MCAIVGYVDLTGSCAKREIVEDMMAAVAHRGPDSASTMIDGPVGFGFRRLAIVDPAGGDQPLFNATKSVAVICNGEIFNFAELLARHLPAGVMPRTKSDCEALVYAYEAVGIDVPRFLNGQFAFAIYDRKRSRVMLARDHFGIAPLYYSLGSEALVFGSEIKAVLRHPAVRREVDLVGLDQVVCFPGLVSPRTMFADVRSLAPGEILLWEADQITARRYWDLQYPLEQDADASVDEASYEERLRELIGRAVRFRLSADVPVGILVSGGLDSSLIAGIAHGMSMTEAPIRSFSVSFSDGRFSEERYQRLLISHIESVHTEVRLTERQISQRLPEVIYHSEQPVKETYNACSLAISRAARDAGVKVLLGGEGADELYAGYPGYKFDAFRRRDSESSVTERAFRSLLWGDADLEYEQKIGDLHAMRQRLYTGEAWARLSTENALSGPLIDYGMVRGRARLHQRSYLDFRLRLADHLLIDHGDHMLMANGVEGRYPFLDRDVVELSRAIPPQFKLRRFEEKYLLKKVAGGFVPDAIIRRDKFGFHAPASPAVLRSGEEWVKDMLSHDRLRKDGIFSVAAVDEMCGRYLERGFRLDARQDNDVLMIVLSFNLLMDMYFR